jgi:exoribonuclease-2
MKGDTVIDLIIQRQNAARNLIEEFMVAANETMVYFLEKAKLPMIQRVVRVPKYWEEIRLIGAKYGERLPMHPDARSLSLFLTNEGRQIRKNFLIFHCSGQTFGIREYVLFVPGKNPLGILPLPYQNIPMALHQTGIR